MDKHDALAAVIQRNVFYKRLHYLALAALLLALIVIVMLGFLLAYFRSSSAPPLYFSTDKVGRIIEAVPVSQPNMREEDVAKWAIDAVEAAYSMDYVNYRSQLQSAQKYFTNYGWSKYMNALRESNNLIALKRRKMIVSAKVAYQPKLLTRGRISGAYAWKYKMSLLVTYMVPPYDSNDRNSQYTNPLEVDIIVQRQSEQQSYKGLGVLQLIGKIAAVAPVQGQSISAQPVRR